MNNVLMIAGFMLAFAPAPVAAQPSGELNAVARIAPSFERERVLVAEGRAWRCLGDACRGTVPARPAGQDRVCRRLGMQVEQITAFEVGDRSFSEEELARCHGRRGRPAS